VRAAIARAVGQATGEAAREALRVILDGPPARHGYQELPDDRDGGWGMARRPTWPHTNPYDPYPRDRYEPDPDEEFEEQRRHRYEDADQDSPADDPVDARRPGRWPRAVAAGRPIALTRTLYTDAPAVAYSDLRAERVHERPTGLGQESESSS
jgi:hypothetical protein